MLIFGSIIRLHTNTNKMKTYIINSIKKIKFHKENIDIKQFICDKPWLAFNELGEEELYIFLPSGIMVISRHGNVTNASWKYINANKTIIITTPNGSVMVHPAYYDDLVIALQKDRTDEYAILINENNKDKFKPQNIIDVNNYFDNKCLNDSNRDIKIEYSNKKNEISIWKVLSIFYLFLIIILILLYAVINL